MKPKLDIGSNVFPIIIAIAAATSAILIVGTSPNVNAQNGSWTSSFNMADCNFFTTGTNPYFILQPGYQLVFAGVEDGEPLKVTVTVSNETKVVRDGIVARVVEERTVNSDTNDLKEITRDYFAICDKTNSVFYFGEDVSNYENGELVDHEGSWLHGSDNARAGLIMPGTILLGSRYYQEIAPEVALDKAEIVSMNQTLSIPAGSFRDVIKMIETNDLEPGIQEDNLHALGIGQVIDNELELVSYGYSK
ncbi:MAG: hypothetical protein ACRD5E_04410 [Nitrososphaeraceae archaeon]